MALRALGRSYDANAVYRDAVAMAPKDPALNTAWGELFLDTHQPDEAIKSFRDALEVDGKYAPALFGAARALAGDDPPQANAAALKALEINPSDVAIHVFLADQAIDAGKRDEARQILEKAIAINPSSLDALSLRTGLDYIEDKQADFNAGVTKVLTIAPRHGEVYRMAGELAARNYRFDEAVSLVRRALELDSSNAHSLGDLGVHLLRTGDEPGARRTLEASFKIDPFDKITYNLLQMMDTLDKFVTLEDGDVVMRMHPDEAPLLLQGLCDAARASGAHDAVQAVRLHPEGSDPRRSVPEARRLRRSQRRAAWNDWRPRRVLRPGGHDGFAEGAAARRIPMGSHAVARARARHHAADVEPASAALAVGRHLGLRRERRAARVGQEPGNDVRRHDECGRGDQASRI